MRYIVDVIDNEHHRGKPDITVTTEHGDVLVDRLPLPTTGGFVFNGTRFGIAYLPVTDAGQRVMVYRVEDLLPAEIEDRGVVAWVIRAVETPAAVT